MVTGSSHTSNIPEQILKQAEEAERLHREWMASLEGGPTGQTSAEIPATGTTGKTGETIEKPIEGVNVPKVENELVDKLKKDLETSEQRYKVLQGKYNAEVPDFALKLNEALNRVEKLAAELNAAKSSGVEVKDVLKDIESDPSIQYIKTDLPDVWTAVNLLIQKNRESSAAEIKKIREELDAQKQTVVFNSRDKFYKDIAEKVGGWEAINVSPEWIAWLSVREPYSGLTRKELINDAYNKMDSARTISFFTDYIEESGLAKKSVPVINEPVAKKKTEDIVPESSATKKPVVESLTKENKEIIDASEVTKHYRELERVTRMGQSIPDDLKIRGIQIDKAVAEGRVK